MANEKNLIPNSERTPKERKELASKAGKASGKARRERKTARELMLYLLNLPLDQGKPKDKFKSLKDIRGKNVTALTAGLANLTKDVANGDPKAIDLALRIAGEMVEQISVQTSDENIEKLKEMLESGE